MTTTTGQTLQMTYDDLQRLTSVASNLYTKNYTYKDLSDRTTNLVSQLQYAGLPTTLAFGYTYDAAGNIASYTAPGQATVVYTYDDLGQLLSAVGDQTYTYSYDSVGNILTANGHTYTYGNANWKDLLTAYDGQSITYDTSGNPTSYYNGTRWTFTWKNGKSLATATDGTTSIYYTYDSDGLRTSKTVGGVVHNYFYASGQLLREAYGSNVLDFFYDANGYPYALKYNGTTYYYITNLQGDVMYLVDGTGATVASYEYDPYGNILSATGEMAEINPLRYRGYYYDAELEMYYLRSRYYDPMVGRFINADDTTYLGSSGTTLSYNLLTYCENNPVNACDPFGTISVDIDRIGSNRYRFSCYFSDDDIRLIKLCVSIYDRIGYATIAVLGATGAIPSAGTAAVAATVAFAITEAIIGIRNDIIAYFDHGYGATISVDFGIGSYVYYITKYGWYRTFWGYRWGAIGLTKQTAYYVYLCSLPKIVWHKSEVTM